MESRYLRTFLALIFAVALAGCSDSGKSGSTAPGGAAGSTAPEAKASAPASPQNKCLKCHGPFEKVIAGATNYLASSGERITVHRYVPHNSRAEGDIPPCLNCHTAHSTSPPPQKGAVDVSKVNTEWCFSCHHERNFKSCKECHPQ